MYLEQSDELEQWMQRATADGRYGIDLEFIRERTYYPQLALIQIAVGTDLALIDPLGEVDLTPLIETISDPSVIKVVHAGSQDLEILEQLSDRPPRAIFDTQIASAFLGLGLQPSYAATCGQLLGVVVEKGESWTDWLRRPLTREQEIYAIDDVRHLLPIHDRLTEQLESEGKNLLGTRGDEEVRPRFHLSSLDRDQHSKGQACGFIEGTRNGDLDGSICLARKGSADQGSTPSSNFAR